MPNTTHTAALLALGTALGEHDEARVKAKALSVGLYVLGLDPAGDYALEGITDAMHGEGSDEVYNLIVAAADAAHGATARAERQRRAEARA